MMGRASEPEMPRSTSVKAVPKLPKVPKLPRPPHSGTDAASQDRLEWVNVAAGGQAIVGVVPHRTPEGGPPENQDQPYGTDDERAGEPATDTPVWSETAGRLALPEAEIQGSDTLSAARRGTRQRRTPR